MLLRVSSVVHVLSRAAVGRRELSPSQWGKSAPVRAGPQCGMIRAETKHDEFG
jgi:hypothetical protein